MQLASPNIKVIYSISSSFRDIIYDTQTGRVLDDCCDVLELENLDIETSRLFIKTFLGKYNKVKTRQSFYFLVYKGLFMKLKLFIPETR